MPESKYIETKRDVVREGGLLYIIISYFKNILMGIIEVFISGEDQNVNSVAFIQGEGGVTYDEILTADIYVNGNGELIIVSDDADKYSINNDGELIYTEA